MASTRGDPNRDLDYIPRWYPDGPAPVTQTPTPRSRQLTHEQAAFAARRREEAEERAMQAPLEPDFDALEALTPGERAHTAAQIRAIRAAHFGGGASVADTTEIQPVQGTLFETPPTS